MRYQGMAICKQLLAAGMSIPLAVSAQSRADGNVRHDGYIDHRVLEEENGESLHEVRFLDELGHVRTVAYYSQLPDMDEIVARLRYDIDFSGGGLGDLMDTIARGYLEAYRQLPETLRESGKPIRVKTYVPAHMRDIELPPLQLRWIHDLSAVNRWLPRGLAIRLARLKLKQDIWTVTINLLGARKWAVYNLRASLLEYTIEDILSLLETAWQMERHAVTAAVKYHEPTETLHILGSSGEITIAGRVFDALPKVPQIKMQIRRGARKNLEGKQGE